jgi:outer membrane protein OmpA-like peptidoglycan-associated protein
MSRQGRLSFARALKAKCRHVPMLFVAFVIASLCACSTTLLPVSSAKGAQSTAHRDGVCVENLEITALRGRLQALTTGGQYVDAYDLAKAQCWLDSAESQFAENDRTGYVSEAMEESAVLIRSMEANKGQAAAQTKRIAGSDRVRYDLWQLIGAIKADRGFKCVSALVACAEVRLVRAGHALDQTGWRQANPHIQIAEGLLAQAQREGEKCRQNVVAAPTAAEAKPAPVPVVVEAKPTTDRFSLQADALFAFNRADLSSLLPAGKAKLDWVVQRLKEYQRIDRIDISGFTDRLGTDKYNLQLSQARANTARDYLVARGISAPLLNATGKGKSRNVSGQCPPDMTRSKLIECLQPDRRVELEILGIAIKPASTR